MSWFKELVSQDLQRYQDEEFNLDLTYITPRLIAMGFPASGVEGMFRNHIDDISQYLLKKHPGCFLVFNLSKERDYNHDLLDNRVINMRFLDHHAPPLTLLFRILLAMDFWLQQHPKNVAVVHCLAGRGRTGLVITSYLVFSGMLPSTEAALNYYAQKRSQTKKGVSQPSQRRYAGYIDRILHFGVYPKPRRLRLVKIKFGPVPRVSSLSGIKPMIYIYNNTRGIEEAIFVSDGSKQAPHYGPDVSMVSLKLPSRPVLLGDIVFKMYHIKSFAKIAVDYEEVIRHMFHTGMEYNRANTMKLTKIRPTNAPPPAFVDAHVTHLYDPTCLDCVKYRSPDGAAITPQSPMKPPQGAPGTETVSPHQLSPNLHIPQPIQQHVTPGSPSVQTLSPDSRSVGLNPATPTSQEKILEHIRQPPQPVPSLDFDKDPFDEEKCTDSLPNQSPNQDKPLRLALETLSIQPGLKDGEAQNENDTSPRPLSNSQKEKNVLLNTASDAPQDQKGDVEVPLANDGEKAKFSLNIPPPKVHEADLKSQDTIPNIPLEPQPVQTPNLSAEEVKPKVIPFSAIGCPSNPKEKDYLYFTFTKSEIDLAYRDSRFPEAFIIQFVCVLEESNFVITAPECWDETQYSSLMAVHQFNAHKNNKCKCSPSFNPDAPSSGNI